MSDEANRKHPNLSPLAEGNGRKRIINACVQCQSLKRRCDGTKPSCQQCTKLKKPCQYAERRRRGPGKKKEKMELLEERLRIVESSLREPHSEKVLECEATGSSEPRSGNVTQPNPQVRPSTVPTNFHLMSDNLTPSVLSESDAAIHPKAIAQQPTSFSTYSSILNFTKFATEIANTVKRTQARMDRTPFHWRVFAQLPSKPLVMNLLQEVLPEMQLHGILLPKESIFELVDELYVVGVEKRAPSPSHWAMANSFFAAAIRHKTAQGSLEGMSPTIWSYFKNAFAVFPELVIQAPELPACEALLAMAMFMFGTADTRVTLQLTATAARLAYSLGLHRRRYYLTLEDMKAERCRRVLWVTYILGAEVMHKYGVPSPFQNENIFLPLPGEDSVGDKMPVYYRKLAEIAVIQSKIHNLLLSGRPSQDMDEKLIEEIGSTYKELQLWKRSLPQHLQEPSEASEKDPDMAVALLHFKYYSCAAKIHVGMSRIVVFEFSNPGVDPTHIPNQTFSSIKMTRDMAAAAARGTIGMLRHLPLEPFPQVWEMLCYPLSAVLLLLSCILIDPGTNQSKSDVEIIARFVKFLKRVWKDERDMCKLLDGCIRIHKTAEYAVDMHEASEQPMDSAEIFPGSEMREKLESLHNKLSTVTDWLHLAQGLLCNISMLRVEAEEVLSDVLGAESTDGVYGAFVPELLKSHNYNFSYGS